MAFDLELKAKSDFSKQSMGWRGSGERVLAEGRQRPRCRNMDVSAWCEAPWRRWCWRGGMGPDQPICRAELRTLDSFLKAVVITAQGSGVIKGIKLGLESVPSDSVCGPLTTGFTTSGPPLHLLSWATHRSGGLKENNIRYPSSSIRTRKTTLLFKDCI